MPLTVVEGFEKENEKRSIVSSYEMEAFLEREPDNILDVRSNIPGLDKAVEGFRNGEVIVISGPTKHGKTLLAQSLTYEFAKQNEFALWFSFEVPARQFISQFPELPLFYIPLVLQPNSMKWLEQMALESFEKYHTRIIFIDHLHYLFDLARSSSPSIEIGTVIRRLKTLAVQNNFIVFLLCHTKKNEGRGSSLSFESIRDSSFVSQESDSVLLITRDTKDPETQDAWVQIEFHRRTGVMRRKIALRKIDGLLKQIEGK